VIRINLLPHREEKRKARREQFFALAGLVAGLAATIWFFGFSIISGYISNQDGKNEFLKKEIAVLERDISEINRLREQTEQLLSRKRIIEALQADRAETVHLFNELARQVPDGIYLKSLKQSGQKINLTGYAQSNARVSTLMRNLEASPLMEKPDLVEIKTSSIGNRRLSEFNLNILITRQTTVDEKKSKESAPKDKKP
jgi:type IV pilus assembly protein PilN